MKGTALTVGSFDGVHRGHQAVLGELVRRARERGLESVAITFDPHPLEVVNPAAAPRLLTLEDEKRELHLRTSPELRFELDRGLQHALRIDQVLKRLKDGAG